jgi:hypothetical protein
MSTEFIREITLEEFDALADQEPPIIIKPGPRNGFAPEAQVKMLWENKVEDEFGPASHEQVDGRWKYVYRHKDESKNVRYLVVKIASAVILRIDFPLDEDFEIRVRYD